MASTTAKGKYPEQLIAMVSAETKDRIRREAAATDRSISEVARNYLEVGIAATEDTGPVAGGNVYVDKIVAPDQNPVVSGRIESRRTDPTFF